MTATIADCVFEALGTTVWIGTTGNLEPCERAVREVVAAVDAACSRFRDDSELARVNASDGQPQHVSPLFTKAVRVALAAAEQTDGAVDPTIGEAIRVLGYDVSFDRLADGGPTVVRMGWVPGWRCVELDEVRGTVRVPRGVELDLGATAKALAVDLAATAAAAASGAGALVSIGGDMASDGIAPEGGWAVGVAESHRTPLAEADEVLTLWHGALATSTTTVRRWTREGEPRHHLIDPATGRSSASDWRTVTVAAPTCVAANTWSTWAVVRGAGAGLEHAEVPYRAVTTDGQVVRGNGWPGST
jgi:thiamine biosynthesis lipoprotein